MEFRRLCRAECAASHRAILDEAPGQVEVVVKVAGLEGAPQEVGLGPGALAHREHRRVQVRAHAVEVDVDVVVGLSDQLRSWPAHDCASCPEKE